MCSTSSSSRSNGAWIKKASWIGAQTSIPASVAAIAAMRIISAPFACMGKFISDRALAPATTRRRQPNTVHISPVSMAESTMPPDHDQNRR